MGLLRLTALEAVSPSGRVLIVRLVGDEPDGGFTV